MNRLVISRLLIAISIIAGLFMSWEPGPEVKRHSHPHDAAHETAPPHGMTETVTVATFFGDTFLQQEDQPRPSDLHYHISFDLGSETGLVQNSGNLEFTRGPRLVMRGTNERMPDEVTLESGKPPLI